ncbi:inositol-3-phosphate synthase [Chitinispirillales bacterium ANBcel5]|uniref:inositol-3-phosphate synthase n=1 Tax=Cellulosispirillum alkaliphilum TaxID=3039283 RepID=UPI002A55E3D1|nr:inositol-3-phosphate synthase [Chitinispirillales bacterium ANBcel5]
MERIKVAVVGVGNCVSSLLQGIEYYRQKSAEEAIGLMHWDIGGYTPDSIEVVAAFDIDKRKVGLDINDAIFAKPNCTTVFCPDMPKTGVKVQMGAVLDGYSQHMKNYDENDTFVLSDSPQKDCDAVVKSLKDSGAEIMLNYLPVGSEEATRFYAQCALDAKVAFVNNIPVFIASDPVWAKKFEQHNLPLIGDDIKAQLGATITHRTLTDLFKKRGVKLERTYQLNTGGNTDFLNMLNKNRLKSKKKSKTEAVQAVTAQRLEDRDIHVGPSDYVPWQNDQKICFIRMEGKLFGDVPMNMELRLSVEDSPNSAGVAIDSIRCCKLALNAGLGGVLYPPSSYFCKHPPRQCTDEEAHRRVEEFIKEYSVQPVESIKA